MTDNSGTSKSINIDLNQWKQKLGTDTLVRIIRIMVGLNRIYALWNLMTQTAVTEEEKNKARSLRNRSVSYVLTNGVLHEIYQILQTLAGDMRERSNIVFEKIKEILVMFDRNPLRGLLTEFRDCVAFHISEDVINTGLSVIKDDIVTFIKYDSDTYRDTYYKFAEDVSIYGFFGLFRERFADVQGKDFDAFYKEKFKQFALYNLEIQTTLVKEFDELLYMMVDEFELEIEESQQENRSNGD